MEKITILNALAEPSRLRIVELLRERPRSVGEISEILGLRQPQATKHLQTLEKAGLALMYPLGQRRVYALTAAPLQELHSWMGTFEPNWLNPPHMLEEYVARVKHEQALADKNSSWADGRSVAIKRIFTVPRDVLWHYWTDATAMKKWWSPDYLTTVHVESDPTPGGVIRVDMQEPDKTIHTAAGHYTALRVPEQLDFVMSPLGPKGEKAFVSHDSVSFKVVDEATTELTLHVRLTDSTAAAVTFIAALEMGWNQTLDKLDRALAAEGREKNM